MGVGFFFKSELPTMREEKAHSLRFKKSLKILSQCLKEILDGSGGQIDKKKKPLIYQGFSEMEHSGIEPLTSTLPA